MMRFFFIVVAFFTSFTTAKKMTKDEATALNKAIKDACAAVTASKTACELVSSAVDKASPPKTEKVCKYENDKCVQKVTVSSAYRVGALSAAATGALALLAASA